MTDGLFLLLLVGCGLLGFSRGIPIIQPLPLPCFPNTGRDKRHADAAYAEFKELEKTVDTFTKTPETCGNCRFGRRVELDKVECHGAPPSAFPIAAGQNMIGQPIMSIQMFWARMPANEPACALWSLGEQVPLIGKN